MMVMPANNTGMTVGYLRWSLAGAHRLYHGPDGWRTLPPMVALRYRRRGLSLIWRRGGTWDEDAASPPALRHDPHDTIHETPLPGLRVPDCRPL